MAPNGCWETGRSRSASGLARQLRQIGLEGPGTAATIPRLLASDVFVETAAKRQHQSRLVHGAPSRFRAIASPVIPMTEHRRIWRSAVPTSVALSLVAGRCPF